MKFSIEGREYDWSAKMTIEEAFFLHEKAYLTIPKLGPAIAEVNPYAIAALVYFAKRRNGEPVKWEDILKLDLLTFDIVAEDEAEEEPGKPEDEPATKSDGKSAGKTRKSSTSST